MPSEETSPAFNLREAERFLEAGDYDEVLAIVESARANVVPSETRAELFYLGALAEFYLERLPEAEGYLGDALSLKESAPYYELAARLALEKTEFDAALAAADRAVALEPDFADAHYARGAALTLLGRLEQADQSFAQAARIEPEVFFVPFRLSAREFDGAVEEALARIPARFRRHLANVEVAVEDVPARELIQEGMGSDLLGLYQGDTIHAGDWNFPDRIILYQRNLENVSPDRDTLVREIRDTVLHEVGHHLGMDEETLQGIEDESESGEDRS
jgi:predicted Zn-dependent protease with MMP-like domain